MKKFIICLIAVFVLASSVGYAAGTIKNSYFNEGLKLAINGNVSTVKFVTVEVEGEQWGRNYVSVADFIKALNDNAGLNVTVDFDPGTQTIIVDTVQAEAVTGKATVPGEEKYTPDGIKAQYWNSDYYIDTGAITSMQQRIHKETSSTVYYSLDPVTIPYQGDYEVAQLYKHTCEMYKSTLIERPKELILDSIDLYAIPDRLHIFIKYDYYVNTIMPLMK